MTVPDELLTYSFDFGAARLDPCELRTVVPYTYMHVKRTLGRATWTRGENIIVRPRRWRKPKSIIPEYWRQWD
ncbi:hypothetical protein EVAR_61440_1 [Eumeta japonica]|uniref:Uncharacterized protein n=1 Tax=Eumeta variegata TaxID=151549 RepID=A0A4C1Y7W3_EUMVA|nr:hypothetical protein EVAR_61440_1 [Eumeta japonica]